MDTLPICQAHSKQSGIRCGNFAVRDRRVCHIHGGKTPRHNRGPKTEAGRQQQKMASWKHGLRSKEAVDEARETRELIKDCKSLIEIGRKTWERVKAAL